MWFYVLDNYVLLLSYATLGQHNEALKLDEETLARRKAKLGPDPPIRLGA